jgi:hypothetical protein
MMFRACPYEKEVTQALKSGHWPEGCAPELRAHVEECVDCSDLVLLTQAFQHARAESIHEAPSGSPNLLWWRAQLRRRNAATEQMNRPIAIAQSFALVLNVLVAAIFVISQYNHGLRWAAWGIAPARLAHLFFPGSVDWNFPLLIPCVGLLILLSGVVVYVVSEKQ